MSSRPILKLRTVVGRSLQEQRLNRGLPWVFSNEIANLADLQHAGSTKEKDTRIVTVVSSTGKEVGVAFFNYRQKVLPVVAHIIANNAQVALDSGFFRVRIERALKLREKNVEFVGGFYRWINGEGDRLPGVFVDRFGDIAVCEFLLPGAEACANAIVRELVESLGGELNFVVIKRNNPMRRLQKLALIDTPTVIDGKTLKPLSESWKVEQGAVDSLGDKVKRQTYEMLISSILNRDIIEEGGVFQQQNILTWDYALRGVRHYVRSSVELGDFQRVDMVGLNAFLPPHQCLSTETCKIDDEELGPQEVSNQPILEETTDLRFPAFFNTSQKVSSQLYKGIANSPDQLRTIYTSTNKPDSYFSNSAVILDLPLVCPTSLPKARDVLLERVKTILTSNPIHRYEYIIFLVKDRHTNSLLRGMLRSVSGVLVHQDFTNPLDFPIHLSTPKNTNVRGFGYRNPNFRETAVPPPRSEVGEHVWAAAPVRKC